MYYGDTYDKILFIAMVCTSFFIVSFTAGMNKTASLLKLLGLVFLIPFALCFTIFIFSSNTPINLILSLSEFCLAAGIFLILFRTYSSKNYNLKVIVILGVAFMLAICVIGSKESIYYSLPVKLRYILTAACAGTAIIFNKKRNGDKKLTISLTIWLVSILLGFIENQQYVTEAIFFIKLSAYAAFLYYFYNTTYNTYIREINESRQIIEKMEHSLHKEVKKRVFEIERSNERLLEISKTDLLTNTFNKITILNIIEKLISKKKEEVFSILMFDIDNFKTINDSLGHITGDICLKTLAMIASSNIRELDYLGRYGGDEFIIVLPTLSENEAMFVAERFRKKVNDTSNPKFTVSIGIATYPYDGQTVKELISAADKGLYKAKSSGKNSIFHVPRS